MGVSSYSIVMAMLWFTLAALIGHFMLCRAEKCGLAFLGMVFLLMTVRVFVPLEFSGSIIIWSQVVYPAVRNWARHPVAGPVTVGGCLLLLWTAGAVLRFAGLARRWIQQRKLRREAELQDGDGWLSPLFQKVAEERGYHGPFHIAVGEDVSSVYQAGFLQPYILLPTEIDRFSDEDICNMFRHELCHFLSRDLWIKAGFQVFGCVLWWNPVMPLLKDSIEQLLELRCDRRVCRRLSAEKQLSYMETLSELVKHGSAGSAPVYVGYLGQETDADLVQRFRMLLLGKSSAAGRFRQIISYVVCIALFVASYCVILQPSGEPDVGDGEILVEEADLARPDVSYIVREKDGTLRLYCGDIDLGTISPESIASAPLSELPIIYKDSSN